VFDAQVGTSPNDVWQLIEDGQRRQRAVRRLPADNAVPA
jgi:hypothetical protein